MDFAHSERSQELQATARAFLHEHVLPAEPVYAQQRRDSIAAGAPHALPPVVEELKTRARAVGLWNLFLPAESGVSVLDYAPVAEISGWAPHVMPEAMNCSAPDTGNMEVLHLFGTPEQKERWLAPLLAGEIRSCFAMTEPDVASSDATNISTAIVRDGDDYVITGRKWWTTGAADPRCAVAIVMGKTDTDATPHRQQSMVLVPLDTPGVTIVRTLPVFGYEDQEGHCEIVFDAVRVPATNLVGEEGGGFAIAQARLGPGRIHHCMRAIGMCERAIDLMVRRAGSRVAFGRPLAAQGVVREWIAQARMDVEQARLLVLKAAWMIDAVGTKAAAQEIAAIKVVVPRVTCRVLDQAIQVHGAGGVSDDFVLASFYAHARTLRLADGPDEVHLRSVARAELGRALARAESGALHP